MPSPVPVLLCRMKSMLQLARRQLPLRFFTLWVVLAVTVGLSAGPVAFAQTESEAPEAITLTQPNPDVVCGGGYLNATFLPLLARAGPASTTPDFAIQPYANCLEGRSGVDGAVASSSAPAQRLVQFTLKALNGFSGTAQISLEGAPAGVTAAFNNTNLTPGQDTILTLTIPPTLPPGAYLLSVRGVSGSLSHTTTFWLIQRAPPPDTGGDFGPRPDQAAALTATALTPSIAFPTPGEMLTLTLALANTGSTALRGVPVYFYERTNLLAVRYVDVVAQRVAQVSAQWTPTAAGVYELTAVIDPNQELTEINRADNTAAASLAVNPAPPAGADFAVTSAALVDQNDVKTAMLRAQVTNKGSAEGSPTVVFRVDGKIVAARIAAPIIPGGAVLSSIDWPAEPAPREFSVEVNPRYKQLEANPDDNIKTVPLSFLPDLRVEYLSVASSKLEYPRPALVTISFQVRNAGSTDITHSFRTRIDPGSTIIDPDGNVLLPYFVTTPALKAGESVFISRTVEPPGSYSFDINIYTDFDLAIGESNENNNSAITHFSNPQNDQNRWYSIGPRSIPSGLGASGRLHAIAVDPTDGNVLYVGAPSGGGGGGTGIFKTTDGGNSWYSVGDSLPKLLIAALSIDPSNHNRIFAVISGSGILISLNGGDSWQYAGQDTRLGGHLLRVSPTDANLLFNNSSSGVLRSINGGANWNVALSGGSAPNVAIDRNQSSHILATIQNDTTLTNTGLYQSFDSGATWNKMVGCTGGKLPAITTKTRISIAQSGSKWYAAFRTTSSSDIHYTVYYTSGATCTINGRTEQTWVKGWSVGGAPGSSGGNEASTFWSDLYADPQNNSYAYATGTIFYVSTDGGKTFTHSSGPHVDHHGFATDPVSPQIIYSLNDGGIYRSSNRGAAGTWQFIGDGIANIEFYDGASAYENPNLLLGGTQDNGTLKFTGSTQWTEIFGGDGASVDIDPSNEGILYAMNQYAASISRYTSATSWKNIASGLPTGADCFNLPFMLVPGNSSTMLAPCLGSLWKSTTNPPGNWSVILAPPSGGGSVAVSQVDKTANLYYAGSNNGRIYAGPAGANWKTVYTHPYAWGVTDIEIDPYTPTVLYASFWSGSGSNRVMMFTRSSAAPTSLAATDLTADLPTGLTIRAIAVDRSNRYTLYAAAAENGVYRLKSYDKGATWTWSRYSDGLPYAVDVRDLIVHPTTGVLYAITCGRSAYQVNTSAPIGSILAAQGRLTMLRINDVGTGYGPPSDFIDGEVIIKLDTEPDKAFGFTLRVDANEAEQAGMLDLLVDAFNNNTPIRIDYERTGLNTGRIIRVVTVP